MKAFIISMLAGAAFIASVEATAQLNPRTVEQCKVLSFFSEDIMEFRQAQLPISVALSHTNDDPILTKIADEAYKRPEMPTATEQRLAISEFSIYILRQCLNSFG